MKKIAPLIFSVVLAGFCVPGGVYDYEIMLANGETHSLGEYRGKKIMIVVLPATQTAEDSAYLMRLDSIGAAATGQLFVIAVPSREDGFSNDSTVGLLAWYQNVLGSNVIVTRGMYTHRSTPEQHALFSWLTHASLNGHFDEEIAGAGQMYFINETGELYGAFTPELKWSNGVLSRLLQ